MKPLAGIQVVDLGRYIAGPYCGALLADLGARVIRVERAGGAEDRDMTPITDDAGSMYLAANGNKESLSLDITRAEGREVLKRLIATSDVVLANLPPRAMSKLGLDLESLRSIRPDIILTTIAAFSSRSDQRDRQGFDGVGQALCGSAYLTGDSHTPMRAAVSWVDFGTASMAALGTVAAIRHRDLTGQGQQVDTSLVQTAMAFGAPALIEQATLQNDRVATANRGPQAAPADVYPTVDGWVIVYAVGDAMFQRWAALVGENSAYLTDERFRDDASRGIHGAAISERMTRWTQLRTTEEVLAALRAARLPAAPVHSPQDALADADLMSACGVTELDYPGGNTPYPSIPSPVQLLGTPAEPPSRAPTLGEHTDAVLRELKFSDQEIQALHRDTVV